MLRKAMSSATQRAYIRAVQALAVDNGPLQLSLFDERDLAEISAPELFPGQRLIVCRSRDLPPNARASARRCWRQPNGT